MPPWPGRHHAGRVSGCASASPPVMRRRGPRAVQEFIRGWPQFPDYCPDLGTPGVALGWRTPAGTTTVSPALAVSSSPSRVNRASPEVMMKRSSC